MSDVALKQDDQTGVFDLTSEQYHKGPGISNSQLKILNRSPGHYKAYLENPPKQTPSLIFGTAFHTAILEPHLFNQQYAKLPENLDKRTKLGKETYENFMIENHSKIHLSSENWNAIENMVLAVKNNELAQAHLTKGVAEKSVYWRDPITGHLLRCRPDFWRDDDVLIDIKSMEDSSAAGFHKAIGTYRYDIQSAFYLEGVGMHVGRVLSQMVHICVEKEYPYAVNMHVLDDISLAAASLRIRELLEIYDNCVTTGKWPSSVSGLQVATSPSWLLGGNK